MDSPTVQASTPTVPVPPAFDDVYEAHFDFVWRVARRLGVPDRAVDDAVQDVFIVVHRRLPEFEGRASIKSWLYAIARRVARDHRRHVHRKEQHDPLPEPLVDPAAPSPRENAARAEAVRQLHALLDGLDDDKREVFVLAELEQMTAPEISVALEVNLNTIYSRLRAARLEFEQGVARLRARDRGPR